MKILFGIAVLLFHLEAAPARAAMRLGSEGVGGGSGCMALIMQTSYHVSLWLSEHGAMLTPALQADRFLAQADPDDVVEVPATEELTYKGNPVDAFFDGKRIRVRCDRLDADSPEARQLVIAHELFRKMGLEGDRYEVSRQIWNRRPVDHGPTRFTATVRKVINFPNSLAACVLAFQTACQQARFQCLHQLSNSPACNQECLREDLHVPTHVTDGTCETRATLFVQLSSDQ